MKNSDTLLVGFDHVHGDIAVLIVGRKGPDGTVEIINQFQGKEAEEMCQKLVEKNSMLSNFNKKEAKGHDPN